MKEAHSISFLDRKAAMLLLPGVLFAAIWSGSFIATKVALPLASPLWLCATRLAAAGSILLVFFGRAAFALVRRASPPMRWRILAAALLCQSYYLGATVWALMGLPASLVSIIGSSLPLVSIPVGVAVLKERATWRESLITFAGVASIAVVIAGRAPAQGILHALLSPAVLLMISAVAALAWGNTLLKSIVGRSHVFALVTGQMVVGSAGTMLAALILEGRPQFHFDTAATAGFAYIVLIGSIAGTWLWVVTLDRFSSISASGFFLLMPLFGIAFGWLVLGEAVSPVQLVGIAFFCASILARALAAKSGSNQA